MFRYAVTIARGALLLFMVQPMIGKFVLPWFGGGPGVWTTCLLFFQVALLLGYAYAHGLAMWVPVKWQAAVHVGMIAVACASLPIIPADGWRPSNADDPTLRILAVLATTLGLPYFILASTGPLMQAWFSRTHVGRSPYRLYALSNAGSLLGLVAYPFVIEPAFSRHLQAVAWSGGFVVFALFAAWCAWWTWKRDRTVDAGDAAQHLPGNAPKRVRPGTKSVEHSPGKDVVYWLALPGCATMLLMAATAQMSYEIAPIPFLWVLPLAAFLLTFIICFDRPHWYRRTFVVPAMIVACWLMALLVNPSIELSRMRLGINILGQNAGHISILFISCMACHGELYRLRPPPAQLTAYYLSIALGGALGGMIVTLIAPLVFTTYLEYPLVLFTVAGLTLLCLVRDPTSRLYRGRTRGAWLSYLAIILCASVVVQRRAASMNRDRVGTSRNFYGVLSLHLRNRGRPESMYMELMHGRIAHGLQLVNPEMRSWPTAYFGPETGVGLALRYHSKMPLRVGIVGLGVGTVAAYGRPGDVYRFYEINPKVVEYAREIFTYLADSQARTEVVLGDARLSLEREVPQNFDVLILDAFSGDAIPMHLLTKEAFETYERHLSQGGVITVHISNRYIDLVRVLKAAAGAMGYTMAVVDNTTDPAKYVTGAQWVLMTKGEGLRELPDHARAATVRSGEGHNEVLWTDDHASLLPVLK